MADLSAELSFFCACSSRAERLTFLYLPGSDNISEIPSFASSFELESGGILCRKVESSAGSLPPSFAVASARARARAARLPCTAAARRHRLQLHPRFLALSAF